MQIEIHIENTIIKVFSQSLTDGTFKDRIHETFEYRKEIEPAKFQK